MKLETHRHQELIFLARPGTSDYKTFEEVIVRNTYERKYFKIQPGEKWIDLGGNVGAFTIQAISKGAQVDVYEPDPFNCKMIEMNLKANNMNANIKQRAVVNTDKQRMTMYVGANNNVWRNSLYKNWGAQKFSVDCVHYNEVLNDSDLCCKMDIEGAEMAILEEMEEAFPQKLVAEWSFDIDPSLTRYRKVVDKLKGRYLNVKNSNSFYHLPDQSLPKNIFPACDNLYCYQ